MPRKLTGDTEDWLTLLDLDAIADPSDKLRNITRQIMVKRYL